MIFFGKTRKRANLSHVQEKSPNEMNFSELVAERLALEVTKLRRDLSPERKTIYEKIQGYLEKNLGQMILIVGFFVTAFGPATQYLLNERNRRLSELVGLDHRSLLSLEKTLTDEQITELSVQDPSLLAPFLLNQLHIKPASAGNVEKIYVRMYEINKRSVVYSQWDHMLLRILPSNTEILEDQLFKNCSGAFDVLSPKESDGNIIINCYLKIIANTKVGALPKFNSALATIQKHCNEPDYSGFCDQVKVILKQK